MTIVQGLWVEGRLPAMQRLSIASFLEHGHTYHLYTYGDVWDVPKGTTVCDGTTILSAGSIFSYQNGFGKGSYSAFSNLFRYKLILDKGGWWVDTDVVCLRPFDFGQEFVFATEREDDGRVLAATCAFKCPAGAPHLEYCLSVSHGKDKGTLQWSEIGPYLFDEAVRKYQLIDNMVPAHVFNPIDYFAFHDIIRSPFDPARLRGSYAVHLWNQMWKSHEIDPSEVAEPRSLYAELRRRFIGSRPDHGAP